MPFWSTSITQCSRSAVGLLPALAALQAADGPNFPQGVGTDAGTRIHSVFNPVPPDQMRPMTLDRPDKTESPYTVDAGHVQVEMDLMTYAWDRGTPQSGGTRPTELWVAPMNWKIGVVNHVDLQCILRPYQRLRGPSPGDTVSGAGDVTGRLKINCWGDFGGPTALAVMPFITVPSGAGTESPRRPAGGIIVPFALELPGAWSLGLMTEADLGNSNDGTGVAAVFVHTATVGHVIAGPVSGYLEFFSAVGPGLDSPWVGTVDVGVTWAINDNWILDLGFNIGVTAEAPDYNPFLGISHRF
ncbi:MAG: transporter [Verrucomicrobiales bacterium]|nr:transporter [Verrucomicrobiales bacterium]